MELTLNEIKQISEALSCAQSFLSADLDTICDENYKIETEKVLEQINRSINITEQHLYNKQNSL